MKRYIKANISLHIDYELFCFFMSNGEVGRNALILYLYYQAHSTITKDLITKDLKWDRVTWKKADKFLRSNDLVSKNPLNKPLMISALTAPCTVPTPPKGVVGTKGACKKGRLMLQSKIKSPYLELIPKSLQSPEFEDAWKCWAKDRRDRKKPLTELAAKRGLNKLSKLASSPKEAIDIIDQSIRSHWSDFFELKVSAKAEEDLCQEQEEKTILDFWTKTKYQSNKQIPNKWEKAQIEEIWKQLEDFADDIPWGRLPTHIQRTLGSAEKLLNDFLTYCEDKVTSTTNIMSMLPEQGYLFAGYLRYLESNHHVSLTTGKYV